MPKIDIDYSNTIIYKIYCDDSTVTDLYVGHTTNFIQRKHTHKQNCINENTPHYQLNLYKVIRDNGGWDNWRMEIVTSANCKDHYEARIKEQEYITSLNATLNDNHPVQKPKHELDTEIKSIVCKTIYKCITCNITCQSEQLLNIHNKTNKHNKILAQKLILQNVVKVANVANLNVSHKFICECCDYYTSKKSSYDKHILTGKHIQATKCYKKIAQSCPDENRYYLCKCGKKYSHHSSLWKHQKTCNEKCGEVPSFFAQPPQNMEMQKQTTEQNPTLPKQQTNELVMSLLNQNMELQKQIIELYKDKNTVINNTTNNTTNNNNNFNLNLFLNEQCKDALNIMDFINQLKLKLSDLDMVGRIGYTEGISQIFIRGLKELDIYKRPIHCSDLKRETLYVKDKDAWEKENGEKTKLKLAIKHISAKNIKNISAWIEENPDSENIDTKKHMEYHNIIINATGGSTEEEDERNYNKIIKNLSKEVVINKES